MMDDDTFAKIAKTDFTVKLIPGVIVGILAVIAGIILIIAGAVKNVQFIIPLGIAIVLVGVLVGLIDGFLLFGRKKKTEENKEEKTE